MCAEELEQTMCCDATLFVDLIRNAAACCNCKDTCVFFEDLLRLRLDNTSPSQWRTTIFSNHECLQRRFIDAYDIVEGDALHVAIKGVDVSFDIDRARGIR